MGCGMRSRHLWLTLLAAAVLVLPGCAKVQDGSNAIVVGGDDDGFNGALLTEPYDVPALPLTDTDGARYSLAKDADQPADAGVLRLHPLPRHLPDRDGDHRLLPAAAHSRRARRRSTWSS